MPSSQKGFTLVEIAIVMIIIGLFIAAIVKGNELVHNSRINKSITQAKAFSMAATNYLDKYNSLPGDDVRAAIRLPGCTPGNFCISGDGNNVIGAATNNYSHFNQAGLTTMPAVESSLFWKHLVLSDIMAGIESSANPANPEWGVTHPKCNACGGWHVLYSSETGANIAVGHFFQLRQLVTGDPHPTGAGVGAVDPQWALQIDIKMDDSKSNSGQVRADDASGLCADPATGTYNTPLNTSNCLMIIKMM